MSDFWQKIVVALISIVGSALVAYFVYLWYQKPSLELAEKQAQQALQEKAAADAKSAEAEKKATEARDRLNKIQQAWDSARNQFLREMQDDIRCALTDPRAWEGKPHPSPIECAQRLINHRDEARQKTLQISADVGADMTEIYQNLDSDIDALQTLLAKKPTASMQEILQLVQKINANWANKVVLITRLAEQAMRRTGCPVALASNP